MRTPWFLLWFSGWIPFVGWAFAFYQGMAGVGGVAFSAVALARPTGEGAPPAA